MMKILCVAVVVLSLASVCQPAPLACEKLLKPVDKIPDLSGSWYAIALSSDVCLVPTLVAAVVQPSIEVNCTSEALNIYKATFKVKMYGYCTSDTDQFLSENNTLFEVDSNNVPTGTQELLLQSGCPDCIVVRGEDVTKTLLLFSRRKTVTAAELKEFETQTKCLGWFKPHVLNADHDYENCPSLDDDDTDFDISEILTLTFQRLQTHYTEALKCLFYDPIISFQWVPELWAALS